MSGSNKEHQAQRGEPIAIIGSGCRFPGDAITPSKLWELLQSPRDVLSPLTDRLNGTGWYHPEAKYHGHTNVQSSYQLSGGDSSAVRCFDAHFFGINAVEANTMDPQMRLLLETVFEALESAGQSIEALQGSDTAVYTGQMVNTYKHLMERDMDSMGTYHVSGTSRAMMSNRISYFFDWHGPSISSLIALHQAVQQLRSSQSRVAIVAGSNLLLDTQDYVGMSNLGMLSPDSRSRMWDADANGYARGEGVAAVVLKTLSQAEADGDDIECVIRETATNQDGKTPGITMPSAAAQAQLIRDCYARAGLDPSNPLHRPQYFEAHGTGTQAGDPVEAEAISVAFFPGQTRAQRDADRLWVGSVKTIIGHTEGTAGLAGLLKASLALQNERIPQNLLFNRLNPKIEPFYSNLRVPTSATPWPPVAEGKPRRASVNRLLTGHRFFFSFGFGGANAHAILESYAPAKRRLTNGAGKPAASFSPFVFSAASETSLSSYISSFCDYLQSLGPEVSLRDVAMTLHSRRTRHAFATAVAALSASDLHAKLQRKLQGAQADTDKPIGIRSSFQRSSEGRTKPRILGVFTGQGAQSARMGAALIERSAAARSIIDRLEARLAQLPSNDRPPWSLKAELLKDASSSRIGEAALSQPLCTALQILQVDLLRAGGVEFAAVVGHSSGEIGAAYAAGLISAEDAICIAYYRGLHSALARGREGQAGAMMAVGTSLKDAQELIDEAELGSRVAVAAVNSAVSLTLSGDEDAIEELKTIFEDEKKFARRLKVDKAYHSHHMAPCSQAYLQSLRALNVQISPPRADCTWFSSCDGGKAIGLGDRLQLKDTYWNNNMVRTVEFMQAIEGAWTSAGPFDMALEVGPHPALKGPALQTIQDLNNSDGIPYAGLSARDKDAVEAFADGLGSLWTHMGKEAVNLAAYDRFLTGDGGFRLVKGLPSYAWDHDKEYWHESRYTKSIRLRSDPVHELLGHLLPENTDQEMRWRNILSPAEVPWLKGHALQHQTVFPAAGYVIMALEATMAMCKARGAAASLVEILDLDIGKALAFDSDVARVETVFSLSNIVLHDSDSTTRIDGLFRYNAAANNQSDTLELLASGRIRVTVGDAEDVDALPARGRSVPNLLPVDPDEFYSSLLDLEYQYTGPFRALSGLQRKLGFATGLIANKEPSPLLVHPAVLDAAFQSVILAHAAPGSGGIWSLHVPKTIRAVRFNPRLCADELQAKPGRAVSFDCHQPADDLDQHAMSGDVDLFPDDGKSAVIQVEGLRCVPFSRATAKDDKELFATITWDVAVPDAARVAYDGSPTEEQFQLARLLERMAVLYLRRLEAEIALDHPARREGPYPCFFKFAQHVLALAAQDKLPLWSRCWKDDTAEDLALAYEPYKDTVDVQLLTAIGENVLDIVTGRKQAIEIGMRDNMLARFYEQSIGIQEHTAYLARLLKQISHRYPHMDILEVGAGTGGITKAIFAEMGHRLGSYTYTDISPGFFEAAQHVFAPYADKMLFKVLDISKDPCSQGYREGAYDMVVASMVLHATPNLQETLRNCRRLLRPGGFLVVLELQVDNLARMGAIFGAFPGWWLGADEGRVLSPCINLAEWDEVLRNTGFSGCDTATPLRNALVMPPTVFVSSAVDERVEFLRDPLASELELFPGQTTQGQGDQGPTEELVLLGGTGSRLHTSRLVGQLKSLLRPFWGRAIRTVRSLSELSSVLPTISPDTTVLSVADLDTTSVLQEPTETDWTALKRLLQEARTVLWVTRGRRAPNPHANMMVGLLRGARKELPQLDMQFLDFETAREDAHADARDVAEALLRLRATAMWHRKDGTDSLLATIEPELVKEEDGRMVIPRVVVCSERNARYNALRRDVFAAARDGENLALVACDDEEEKEKGRLSLQRVAWPSTTPDKINRIIRVERSLVRSLRAAEFGSLFAVLGRDERSNELVVALSSENARLVVPVEGLCEPANVPPGAESDFLARVALHWLASLVLVGVADGDVVVVHEPDPALAAVLEKEAEGYGAKVQFTTVASGATKPPGWVTVHPAAPTRVIRALLPRNTVAFVDFSNGTSVADRIQGLLPARCRRVEREGTLSAATSLEPQVCHIPAIRARLERVVSKASSDAAGGHTPPSIVTLGELSKPDARTQRLTPLTVLDWASSPIADVSIRVQPADSQVRFSSEKTYWLAGLSGGLGLALCEWMVRHGAKHIVISSRQPRIDERWLEDMKDAGAVVEVHACDVTRKDAVQRLYEHICATLPAQTLYTLTTKNTPFRTMSLETLLKVTRPKVEGSVHLSELFASPDQLDFFVFFSSASAIPGNLGQANYSAANLFMAALAEQRRRRGLAASIMHIGPIFGVGYIAQQGITTGIQNLADVFVPLCEVDFFQQFAEAVIGGRPGGTGALEIITGVAKAASAAEAGPLLSHYTKERSISGGGPDTDTDKAKVPLKTQLASARDRRAVARIITDALLPKLSALFQVELGKLEKADLRVLRLDEMGIDSLLAVEIRSWFVKTLQVNIPVLKILSGVPVSELVKIATDTIPPALVPMVDEEASQEEEIERLRKPPKKLPEKPGSPETSPVPSSEGDSTPELKSVKLSFSQSLFWFIHAFSEDKTSVNLTGSFRLTGPLRVPELQKAVHALSQQHESLRTCFLEDGSGQPMQGIMQETALELECHPVRSEDEVTQYFEAIHGHVYDLARGKTMRLALLSLSPTSHFFIIGVHHLAMDGTSFQVLMRDLLQHYTLGPDSPQSRRLAKTTRQYAEFSQRQHTELATGGFQTELEYWKAELANLPPTLPILRLSTATARPPLRHYGNVCAHLRIKTETRVKIQVACRRARATPFHFYLAAFRVLLWRYTNPGAEDVSIGIGDMNRTEDDMMGTIGDFVNMLPVQFRGGMPSKFEELLAETRAKVYKALANSRVPFQVLLNELAIPRSATTSPIFQAFVDYRQGQREKTAWGDCELELMRFDPSKLAYDVALDIIDDADGGDCLLTFVVRDDLYTQQHAERLADSYGRLVTAFASQSRASPAEVQIFGEEEIEEALSLGRGPVFRSRQWGKTLVHRIDDVAKKYPGRAAIITGHNKTVTYSEVVAVRATAIAAQLLNAGIRPGSRVAVLQEPTPDWVSSILAVMRVGAVYLPLDTGTPLARLAVMVKDCEPSAVLVDADTRKLAKELQRPQVPVIDVSTVTSEKQSVPVSATAEDACTILYTSGSSGTPKGIVLHHQGMQAWLEPCAMLYGMTSFASADKQEVLLQQSSQGFDMSLMQIFTALCFGGMVYLLPRKHRGDARAIAEAIGRHGITHTYGTPSEYFSWLKYGSSDALRSSRWKTALVGGEYLARSLLREFAALGKDDLRFFHMYGTTEATFCATVMQLDYESEGKVEESPGAAQPNFPAGVALPNYSVYVLDEHKHPLPAGMQGEIYIGGAGVAQGYLNNEALTTEKFMSDPFATDEDRHHRRWTMMQRTGDLGRLRAEADGALLIEGRISGDTMVKLRGLRVDLREVENAFVAASEQALSEAVVSVRRATPDSPEFLVAHVYMRPAFIIPLDRMPATASGKRDRKAVAALPLPEDDGCQGGDEMRWTTTEDRLKRVWDDVLGPDIAKVHRITPETDFFHVGGTSLLLLSLQDKIKAEFMVELTLVDLFEASVLNAMAHRIQGEMDDWETLDWEKETAVRSRLLELEREKGPLQLIDPNADSKIVIITGGSGYLGKALVRSLIADPTVAEVHCLGVRNASKRTELVGLPKVTLYEGDLKQPRIGLSQDTIDSLFARADMIIHNGADISYMKTYQSLRQSNFLTTKDLIEWSYPRAIPMHYISTAGIGMFSPGKPIGEHSMAAHPPPLDGSMGYTACKWASERFLERLVAERFPEWPVCVHRPTLISRDDVPQLDLAHNLLEYSRKLGAWALDRKDDGYVEFANVDLAEIPMDEWASRAGRLGMHPTITAFLTSFARVGEVEFPEVVKAQD
ncbi:hypothetical protein C8A03DRAFT_46686 [Achaetomium macrosporum]|uniref:Uncharacterized protein n=1 Tax=Achaetomium macrosporum TaxID=79813 RepID=A0AAN7C544_9PEZI|nr:hypothetical protein C8A03DRAFT_46686 [Achaetomium macrosporum]